MSKQEKSRKPLIVGIIAAFVILAVLLVLLLTQCVGGQGGATVPTTTVASDEVPEYQLYWNVDRAEYDGKSEAGLSSRMPEEDGYFHVRFFAEGETITLKVADRKLINAIDVQSVMGLEFDEDGIVIGVLNLDDMPLEKVGWQFYVQSAARTMIKLNSSEGLNGMEVLLEKIDPNRVWDMSGKSGDVGTVTEAIDYDKVMAVQNLAGEVTHVFIFERPNYMLSHEGYCEHCKETVEWYEWIKEGTMPLIGGHYQLQNDVQLNAQASLQEDAKLCLDLNGYRIDGKKTGGRVIAMFNPGVTLAIMDTSEDETGVVAAHSKVDQGGCVWVRYGAFYLYSGTLDASDAYGEKGGVAVECGKEKFFYMNGGTIIGGRGTYTYNAEKNTYGAGTGGAVSIGGKFVLNDGVIRDGHAEAAVVYKDGKLSSYQRGFGGNLYLSGTAEFEMNGGTIMNGKAGSAGGNIYADGTTEITVNGGTISGGMIYGKGKNGGSVFVGSKVVFNLNGGSIYGGVSYNAGGTMYLNGTLNMNGGYIGGGQVYNFTTRKLNETCNNANLFIVNGRLNMGGGLIAGHVSATDSKKGDNKQPVINLYGVARIEGSKNNLNLTIGNANDGTKVLVNYLYKGAKIGVNTTIGIFTEPTKAEYKQYFFSDIEGAEILHYQDCLALGRLSCICGESHGDTVSDAHTNGCNGEVLLWAPWVSASAIPTTTGNYFLCKDVTTIKQYVIYSANDVKLDLNGKNITFNVPASFQDGFRMYRPEAGGKLSITDTTDAPGTLRTYLPGEDAVYPGKTVKTKAEKDEDGNVIKEAVYYTEEEMRKAWTKANMGMLVWVRGGEFNLHNGILDGSHLTGAQDGLLVNVTDMTVTDEETGDKTVYDGSFNMYGGTILGGYTRAAGNINVSGGTEMNLYGGTISGGRANSGGNINVFGTLNMYGGTVTDGVVDRSHEAVDGGQGGNICVAADSAKKIYGTMNMYGGVVSGGYVKAGQKGGGHGGNVIVCGTLNAAGGEIRDGEASGHGGNIATNFADSLITLDGVKVLDGVGSSGGNIAVAVRTNKGLYVLGDTVVSGGHARGVTNSGGGNLSVNLWVNSKDQDQIVVIDGATIIDGTARCNGGNIYLRNTTADQFTVNEKTGEEKQTRYQVEVDVTMKSGTVSGGINGLMEDGTRAKVNGGSIYATSRTSFTLEGGSITGGDTCDIGGNIYANGVVQIKGGTVSGGTYKGKAAASGNIAIVNGTLAVSGGVIEGNVGITATKTGACKVLLSGKPVIKRDYEGLKLSGIGEAKAPVMEIDGVLQEGSQIEVTGSGYISTETPVENLVFFNSESDTVIHYNKCLFIGRSYCICGKSHDDVVSDTHINGCDGTLLAWERWTSTTTLPTATGNYYLANDVTTSAQTTIYAGKHVALNLDGHNVTLRVSTNSRDAWRLYRADDGATLAITDITENPGTLQTVMPAEDAEYTGGKFTVGETVYAAGSDEAKAYVKKLWQNGNFGMLLWAKGGQITIHNAILDGSNLTGAKEGLTVTVNASTVTDAGTGEKTVYYGSLTMYNGEIVNGYTRSNGNIYVAAGCDFNLYGGIIGYGRSYKGGNFQVLGTLNVYGGEITGGLIDRSAEAVDAGSGGNINIEASGVMNMKGGSVTNGTAIGGNGGKSGGHGGNIHVYGTLNAVGGTISDGITKGGGGNIATIGSNSVIIIDGAEVLNGQANHGGNVCVNVRVNKQLTITENSNVSGGVATGNGGNVAVNVMNSQGQGRVGEKAMSIAIGGTVTGGTAGGFGGNIYINNPTQVAAIDTNGDGKNDKAKEQDAFKLTMEGATVSGGKSGNSGGNIYILSSKVGDEYASTVDIKDSTISEGEIRCTTKATVSGGNVFLQTVDATITGSQILDGKTYGTDLVNETEKNGVTTVTKYHAQAGNLHMYGGKLVVDSTVISGGYAQNGNNSGSYVYAGNLYLQTTTVELKNGTQILDGQVASGYIVDGVAKGNWSPSGNIFVHTTKLTTTDTIISGGIGNGSASNIYINASGSPSVTLGKGTQVLNTAAGGNENITVGGGRLTIEDGALIQNAEGLTARNINAIAESATTITMTGGEISGGKRNAGGNVYFEYNGDKRVEAVTFNMTGGVIKDGTATSGRGGNLYITQNTVVTVGGGAVISGGSAYEVGGNVYIPGEYGETRYGQLIVEGNAKIIGGTNGVGHTSGQNGGSIYAGYGTLVELKGNASVSGGNATNVAGNIYTNGTLRISEEATVGGGKKNGAENSVATANVFVVNGTLEMSGGTIDGSAQVSTVTSDRPARILLSGSPKILKNVNGYGLVISSSVKDGTRYVDFPYVEAPNVLGSDAEINFRLDIHDTVFSEVTPAENLQYFHSLKEYENVYHVDAAMVAASGSEYVDRALSDPGLTGQEGKLYVGQYHCICGEAADHLGACGGSKLLWTAWNSGSTLPIATGNHYLIKNVALGHNSCRNVSEERRVNLDLNGFEIQSNGGRMYDFLNSSKIYLTFTNTNAETGRIYTTQRTYDQGGIVWGGKEVKLYNVIVDGSQYTLNKEKTHLSGALISSGGTVGLYGTTQILGGDSCRGRSAIEISSTGTLTFDPSVVVDGEIFVGDSAKIKMAGITDASKYTVNASGAFTSGNTITDESKFFASNTEAEIFLSGSEQFAGHSYCICGGANGKHKQFTDANGKLVGCDGTELLWRPYRKADAIPTVYDNWYLTQDVTTGNTQYQFNTAGGVYNLDLNGKTVTYNGAGGNRMFRLWKSGDATFTVTLSVTDTSAKGNGKIVTPEISSDDGKLFWLASNNCTVNVYGGTFDASKVTTNSGKGGANVKISNGTFNQFGGTLIGGTTTAASGGAVFVSSGSTYNLFDGTVEKGYSNGGHGGNVYIAGVMNMYDGDVLDGSIAEADRNGGNIFIADNAVMNLYDGTVSGGVAPGKRQSSGAVWGGYGGNISVIGTLNMYGGLVTDGDANSGDNINIRSRNADEDGTFNMYGGTVAGGVTVDQRTTNGSVGAVEIKLSGAPIIDKALTSDDASKKPANSLIIPKGIVIDATGLTGGRICVSGSGQFGIALAENGETAKAAFVSETADEIYLHNSTELHFAKSYCLCGASRKEGAAHTTWCDGNHSWIEWNKGNVTVSGYYYAPVSADSTISLGSQVVFNTKNIDVVLDLNGQTIQNTNSTSDSRVFGVRNGVHFGITDTVGGGKVSGGCTGNGGTLHVISFAGTNNAQAYEDERDTVLNLYAGTFTRSGTGSSGGVLETGGDAANGHKAVINMYGGTFTGGTVTGKGGNVCIANLGTFNLFDGTIEKGTATADGGNIYLYSGGTFNQTGGSVTAGTAQNGGNIYVADGATVNISGATVSYGTAKKDGSTGYGGNIYMAGGTVNLTKDAVVSYGSVSGKTATAWAPGGNIYANAGVLNVTDSTISNGQNVSGAQSDGVAGNNLYVNYNAQVTLNQGAVVENNADFRQNILVQGGKLTLNGGKVCNASGITKADGIVTNDSWKTQRQSNPSVWPQIEIISGEICGGKVNLVVFGGTTVTQSGGSIHSSVERNVTMNGIVTGTYDDNGTTVTVSDYAEYIMTGGSIYGGNSITVGGNVSMGKEAVLTMSGNAAIYNGTAATSGGNVYLSSGSKLTMSGDASVYGGTAKEGSGGNIHMPTDDGVTNASVTIGGNAKVYNGTNKTEKTSNKPNGGSIYVGKTHSLTLKDNAEVYGGKSCNAADNIYINGTVIIEGSAKVYNAETVRGSANIFNVGGTLDIRGGTVAGGISFNSGTVKLSGAPVIDKALTTNGKTPATSLSVNTGNSAVLDVAGLTGGTVYVTASKVGDRVAVGAASSNVLKYLLSEMKYGDLVVPTSYVEGDTYGESTTNAVYIGNPADTYCLCGASYKGNEYACQCGDDERVWVQWTNQYQLPTAKGNYYLAYNVTVDTVLTPDAGAEIAIDLRGNNIYLDGGEKLYELTDDTKVKLILTDSDATPGSVIKTGESSSDGGILQVRKGSTFEFYRITLDASGFTGTNGGSSNYCQGGALAVFNGGSVIMHSGEIKSAKSHECGGVFLYSNISAGNPGSTFLMKSGTISGGVSNTNAGNVTVSAGCSFTMDGGTISGGTADTAGGNVYITGADAAFIMNGGTISQDAESTVKNAQYGGNVYVKNKGAFTMNDGTISGGYAESGGNVYVTDQGSTFTMNGTITGGRGVNGAGNVRVHNKAAFTMNGGEVSDGVSLYKTKDDGTVNTDAGGNIRVSGASAIVITGGTVKNGNVQNGDAADGYNNYAHASANIFIQNSDMEVSGGQIWGGVAMQEYDQDNDYATAPVLTLSGTPVINGNLSAGGKAGKAIPSLEMWQSTIQIDVKEALQSGSYVGINKNDSLISTANSDVNEASKAYFHADNGAQNIYVITQEMLDSCDNDPFTTADIGKLYIGQIHCVCGGLLADHGTDHLLCDGVLHVWKASSNFGVNATNIYKTGSNISHYWYLNTSITNNYETSLIPTTGKTVEDMHLWLDTNGFDIASAASRLFVARRARDNDQSDYGTLSDCSLNLVNTSQTKSKITVTGTRAQGALIWVSGSAKARLFNLDITASHSDNNSGEHYGALICVDGAGSSAYVNGVSYTGGTVDYEGGEFLYAATNATVINTTIRGANTSAIRFVGTKLTLQNVTIQNNNAVGVDMLRTNLVLAGSTTITGNSGGNLKLTNNNEKNATAVLESFTGTVGISGDTKRALITNATTWELVDSGKIFADDTTTTQIMVWDEGLGLTSAENIVQCACGGKAVGVGDHQCKKLVFTPWTSTTTLPADAGNWYLTENVTIASDAETKTFSLYLSDASYNLDLRGKTVESKDTGGYRLFTTYKGGDVKAHAANAAYSFTDSVGGGKIIAPTATSTNQGGIFWMGGSGNTLNIYGGEFDASGWTVKNGFSEVKENGVVTSLKTNEKNGAAISLGGTVLNLYGGTITGGTGMKNSKTYNTGTADEKTLYTYSAHGGAIAVASTATMNMYGGTVTGGKAGDGGNIYCGGTLNMYAGTISSGEATNVGGNIRVAGTVNISGGTVSGGKAAVSGGNIYVNSDKTLNISDDALITGGTATSTNGGNVYAATGTSFTMKGGTISDGTACLGGNVYMAGTASFTLSDGTITGGSALYNTATGKERSGANIYTEKGSSFTMEDGTVSNGGTYKANGQDRNLSNRASCMDILGSFNMTGGTISGSIFLRNNCVATISGDVTIKEYWGISINEAAGEAYANVTIKDLDESAVIKFCDYGNNTDKFCSTKDPLVPFATLNGTYIESNFICGNNGVPVIKDGKLYIDPKPAQ